MGFAYIYPPSPSLPLNRTDPLRRRDRRLRRRIKPNLRLWRILPHRINQPLKELVQLRVALHPKPNNDTVPLLALQNADPGGKTVLAGVEEAGRIVACGEQLFFGEFEASADLFVVATTDFGDAGMGPGKTGEEEGRGHVCLEMWLVCG